MKRREQPTRGTNVLASLVMAGLMYVLIVVAFGGPDWAGGGFAALTYLNGVAAWNIERLIRARR